MWDGYDSVKALRVLKQHWVKHYGWPEIVIHDQGPEFMGHEFQDAMAAQGILTVPIDSKPMAEWKTERAGASLKL